MWVRLAERTRKTEDSGSRSSGLALPQPAGATFVDGLQVERQDHRSAA